ncbi:MAG: TnsA endonuclease C-terminal domain-containing protein [Cyanobacteria bacterium J06633_8]
MAKRNRTVDDAVISKRLDSGRGQGKGSSYKPWLQIQDVPSIGLATRIKGWKTNRVHHFLSNLELNYFYILEWSSIVTDIREQYPLLPREETLALASNCGIRHPQETRAKTPIVMTCDFLITIAGNIEDIVVARTVKFSKDLQSKRTREKLEIERLYWGERKIDWGIVTEQEIPLVLAKNVEWLHPFKNLEDLELSQDLIKRIAEFLLIRLAKSQTPLVKNTNFCDDQLGLLPGTSLSVVRYLIANRLWLVDMNQPIQPSEPLILEKTCTVEERII